MEKRLVGGQKLRDLGSSRYTDDVDYLIFDSSSTDLFINSIEEDLINCANHPFYTEIWNAGEVTAELLLEMSAFTFVQHCLNMNFDKADTKEFDIKFLTRLLEGKVELKIVNKYVSVGELAEVSKIIESVRF